MWSRVFVKNSLLVYRTDSKDSAILSETITIIICYALMFQLKYFERFVATSLKNGGACILKPPTQTLSQSKICSSYFHAGVFLVVNS